MLLKDKIRTGYNTDCVRYKSCMQGGKMQVISGLKKLKIKHDLTLKPGISFLLKA